MVEKQLKCVFNFGTPCSNDTEMRDFFTDRPKENQIHAPCCKEHFECHKMIRELHANGVDIEKIMQQDWPNYAREQYLIMKLAGLEDNNIKL